MAVIINAKHLFNPKDNSRIIDLVMSMATVHCSFSGELYEVIKIALIEVFSDPRFPSADLNPQAIMHCGEMIQQAHREAAESVLIHSYLTFCQAYGWDPLDLPACREVGKSYNHYLPMRQTLSILTLSLVFSSDSN